MSELPLPEHDAATIVLVGSFNPRIFQPAWFVRQGLLSAEVESDANVELVNNDFCAFETDWFRVEALSDRFVLSTLASPAVEALRDLALGTFQVLSHTPVTKVGLNSHAHFRLNSRESWHEFGHDLAPKADFWDPILEQPGTLSLTVQGERTDDYKGFLRVKIEPSARVENGLFIDTNDEFHMPQDHDGAEWLTPVFTEAWAPSRERVLRVREHLIGAAMQGAS